MSKKHPGGPAPVPPGNRLTTGMAHVRGETDAHAADEAAPDGGAPFQEQDPKRRLGGFTGTGEHSIQQPSAQNDGS